ncbi:unnamed protein product, partial [Rotaria sp. Silwood2]
GIPRYSIKPSVYRRCTGGFLKYRGIPAVVHVNVRHGQLYLWSAPIDVVERYQFYLNKLSTSNDIFLETQVFYNCTLPRFGSMCQYEITYYHQNLLSLDEIIHDYYRTYEYNPNNFTCYTQLQCNRGPFPACLDWSEICDGQVDCLDDEFDEEHCWQLEINECNDNEYRCTNGQCIPQSFFRDDINTHDCLDGSDEIPRIVAQSDKSNKYIHQSLVKNEVCQCRVEGENWCEDEDFHTHYVRKNISFQTICDGFTELIPKIIEGQNETDETECEQWPCNNIYTRCDGLWNCPHGEDELGCDLSSTLNCFSDHHRCVSLHTNELISLPVKQANDGKIDCLGATDEPTLCQEKYQIEFSFNFYCINSSRQSCITFKNLCDKNTVCEHGDDETFCVKKSNRYFHI